MLIVLIMIIIPPTLQMHWQYAIAEELLITNLRILIETGKLGDKAQLSLGLLQNKVV